MSPAAGRGFARQTPLVICSCNVRDLCRKVVFGYFSESPKPSRTWASAYVRTLLLEGHA